MEKIEDVLISIGAKRLIGGIRSWGEKFCPYNDQEINSICFQRGKEESNHLKEEFDNFSELYSNLNDETKENLKKWAIEEFLVRAWNARDFGIRPRWTWENFISKLEKGSSYLDVGPCHGIHSNLIYKYHYRSELNFLAAEVQVPYLQLQKICGIDSKFFDASHMNLASVYEEKSVDSILFTEVLEHLTQDEGRILINDMCKILKTGGKIMISFPVDAQPFDYFLGVPFGHQYQPNIDEVSNQMNESGIKSQLYTKLWSGKTYQHVIIGEKL